jgi:AcrR family transcriptional regulator
MKTRASFRRARKPDEKAQRRLAILDAAAALFVAGGLEGVTLNAVASRAGFAKSNVYRYFENREAIFLALIDEDLSVWVAAVEESLARLTGEIDVRRVAQVLAQTMVAMPRLCALEAAVTTVFELTVSEELVASHKLQVLRIGIRLGNALRAALPAMPATAIGPLLKQVHATVAGLYPLGHPPPSVARALQDPQLAVLRSDFATDVEAMLAALLTYFCEPPPAKPPKSAARR